MTLLLYFSAIFKNLRPAKTKNILLDFWLFTRVLSERELIGRFCDHFHEFEIRKKLDNISIFNYFQEFETKRNDRILIAWLLAVCTNLTPEKTELTARFLSIFTNLRPARSEVVALFSDTFTNLRSEKIGIIARYFAIFTNFRQKKE